MSDQKDMEKRTSLNIYNNPVSDEKSLLNETVYDFANKKTEKLVTALYMVTDCMENDEALKNKLRLLGVELLSDMYKLASLSPMDKHVQIPISLSHINEILSFIEIAYNIGFISEMNTMILKKEFKGLSSQIEFYKSKDKHFTFTLDEKMFETKDEDIVRKADNIYKGQEYLKDNHKRQLNKRTSYNSMSFTNGQRPLENIQNYKSTPHANLFEREERKNKILNLIKNLPNGQKDASIKDISLAFDNCSEKTIQRDLNTLVSDGKLTKIGDKRWSRYSIITN